MGQCSIALAAEVGGELAGFCLVLAPGADYGSVNYGWFAARYDDFAYLDRVAVDERHRDRGIGTALYAEVERRTTARWFLLEVNCGASTARWFHRAPRLRRGRSAGDALRRPVSRLAKDLTPAAGGC